jgi:hypothetical protein
MGEMSISVGNFQALMDLTDNPAPEPPQEDDTVVKLLSMDGKQSTFLVRLDDFTYRYAGIEYHEVRGDADASRED